jgi:hypothetical protein
MAHRQPRPANRCRTRARSGILLKVESLGHYLGGALQSAMQLGLPELAQKLG